MGIERHHAVAGNVAARRQGRRQRDAQHRALDANRVGRGQVRAVRIQNLSPDRPNRLVEADDHHLGCMLDQGAVGGNRHHHHSMAKRAPACRKQDRCCRERALQDAKQASHDESWMEAGGAGPPAPLAQSPGVRVTCGAGSS